MGYEYTRYTYLALMSVILDSGVAFGLFFKLYLVSSNSFYLFVATGDHRLWK